MAARLSSGLALRWVAAAAAVVLTTFLLVWFDASSTAAGMAFLVLVMWTATQAGVGVSLVITALCAAAFDYYFLPPYRTFRLQGAEAWFTMFAFAASCAVVSRLAETARRQKEEARQRQDDVERLYALSQEMMLYSDAEELICNQPRLIAQTFNLEAVALYVCSSDRTYASPSELPRSVDAGLRSLAQGVQGADDLTMGFRAVPLTLGLRPVGTLGWKPAVLSREITTAVAAQVAIVLARAVTMNASARIEAARAADRLRAALVESLTHELRTPLTSIRAAATTLLEGSGLDEPSRQDLVKVIDEESTRLDTLIGQSVEMAELDANVLEVRLAPHHPRAFLDEIVERLRKTLDGHRVSVVTEGPDTHAWFDAHLLERVLRHLLENAASYTPAGSRIQLASRRIEGRLELRVEDDGPGIDAIDLPLIFDKFYRGKRSAGARNGSGMGLAIARAILAAQGGSIEATSEPGQGTCFRCWVPLIESDPKNAQGEALK